MWTAKFGGSSIANAQGIERCARLTISDQKTRLVVLSATYNTTNLLERAAFGQVKQYHDVLVKELNLSPSWVAPLYQEMDRLPSQDWASRCALGERLSSRIFATHLQTITDRPVSLVDARRLMITNETPLQAHPLTKEIGIRCQQEILPLLNKGHIVVTQGFIGSSLNGQTTLLGREGSDYSATLLAEAIGATQVTIWSDVPGIFTADPRIVKTARVLPRLPFAAASALAHCGAKVLFPHTLHPAERGNIPIFVRSSLKPEREGTRISSDIACPVGTLTLVLSNDKLSFIGKQNDALNVQLPEVEQGEYHRTFRIPKNTAEQARTLIRWHEHLFGKSSDSRMGFDRPSADKTDSKKSLVGPGQFF